MKRALLTLSVVLNVCLAFPQGKSNEDYFKKRKELLAAEDASYLGSDLTLSLAEKFANQYLMLKKTSELDAAFDDQNGTFPLAKSFLESKEEIEASEVFHFLKEMPKGAALHLHEFTLVSSQWIIANITYRSGLYMCSKDGWLNYAWFHSPSNAVLDKDCEWENVEEARMSRGNEQVDREILQSIQFVPDGYVHGDINWVWRRFDKMMFAVSQLINLAPIFEEFMYQAFTQFMEDGVQYMEFRSVLQPVCTKHKDLGCDPLMDLELAKLHWRVNQRFIEDHRGQFCGAKIIYSPLRSNARSNVTKELDLQDLLMQELPGFVIGFDLVGQEDLGKPLIELIDILLEGRSNHIPYYFHAGETNWQGQPTDLNLIDALLLDTRRIGHGYAIVKHPQARKLAKEHDVPVEICPISNQVLDLVSDLRNHPGTSLIQDSQPLVISSDDPSAFGAKGLSYDFYAAFMAMSGRNMDLKLLKKLVQNSIKYSDAGSECQAMVEHSWATFMNQFVPELILV